jgi:Ca2+-transporting ATPase
MFGRHVLTIAVLQGVSVLVVVLAVYLWTVLGGRPDPVVRSITFTTLVVANLSLILVNRSWRLSTWRSLRERRNPTLPWILGAAAGLLILLLAVPWLRKAFDFGPMSAADCVVAITAGIGAVAWFEIYKARSHR